MSIVNPVSGSVIGAVVRSVGGASLPWDAGGGIVPYLSAPSQITAPVITGGLSTGGRLHCDGGVWAGGTSRPQSKAFQWYNAGVSLGAGAVSSTYTVVATDSGDALTCIVTATNPIGATASDASNAITVPAITHWLDQSASALDYAQAVAAKKPAADAMSAKFVRANAQTLIAAATRIIPTTYEAWTDFSGAGSHNFDRVYMHPKDANYRGYLILTSGGVGYSVVCFGIADGASALGNVGIADAIGTTRHLLAISHNGGAGSLATSWEAWLDGVSKTIVTGPGHNIQDGNAIGGRADGTYTLGGSIWEHVVFARQLSTPERATLSAWFATQAGATPQDIATAGGNAADLVCWLPRGGGWS